MAYYNLQEAVTNKILLITLSVWAITQGLKVIFGVIRERRFNFKWFIGTGGMPSSHTSGAAALAVSCGLSAGFDSVIFAVTAVFALVTMFDAQGVRRSTGQQAALLNKIMDDLYHGRVEADKLRELIGHTPLEVIMGFFLGIFLSLVLYQIW
ncbi:MAG: divergent PAP2 family protein [Candidatus Omnitrophica bacterium]|nr:divergent PAP2 family protein [Candidatus Omnitrophota bacterium]